MQVQAEKRVKAGEYYTARGDEVVIVENCGSCVARDRARITVRAGGFAAGLDRARLVVEDLGFFTLRDNATVE